MFVKKQTIDVLVALNNGQAAYQSALFDKKFVKTIMQDIFSKEALTSESPLDPLKVQFVKGTANRLKINKEMSYKFIRSLFSELFYERVQNDINRFQKVEYYVNLIKVKLCFHND